MTITTTTIITITIIRMTIIVAITKPIIIGVYSYYYFYNNKLNAKIG